MRDNYFKVSILLLSLLSAHLISITIFHRWKLAIPSKWALSQPGCPFMDFRRERAQINVARWWCEFTRITHASAFHRVRLVLWMQAGLRAYISTRGSDNPADGD